MESDKEEGRNYEDELAKSKEKGRDDVVAAVENRRRLTPLLPLAKLAREKRNGTSFEINEQRSTPFFSAVV